MDLYAENILEHAKSPRHTGRLPDATVEHTEENPACGDTLRLCLKIENGIVTNLRWEGTGCAISQAAMSLLSEEIIGKTEEEILALRKKDVDALLRVPVGPRRFKCALMGLHCVQNALRKASGQKLQGWVEMLNP